MKEATSIVSQNKKATMVIMHCTDDSSDEIMANADPTKSSAAAAPIKRHLTLIHALKYNAEYYPDHEFLRWVTADCQVSETLSYRRLWEQAGLVTTLLEHNGVQAGDRVMIAYPFGLQFLSGLFGCMKAGVIACSVRISVQNMMTAADDA